MSDDEFKYHTHNDLIEYIGFLREELRKYQDYNLELQSMDILREKVIEKLELKSQRLINSLTYINDTLEVVCPMLERPTYNSLEVGFRHSPLTQKEMLERYDDTCSFSHRLLSITKQRITDTLSDLTKQKDENKL